MTWESSSQGKTGNPSRGLGDRVVESHIHRSHRTYRLGPWNPLPQGAGQLLWAWEALALKQRLWELVGYTEVLGHRGPQVSTQPQPCS